MSKAILNKKIFGLAVDERTKPFDENWFDSVVIPTFNADKQNGFLPVAHIGHTNPTGDTQERPRVAFLDNIRRVGKEVFCDFTDIPDMVAPAIEQNLYPNRSVEIRADGKGFSSIALLGGTEPHFKLAQDNQLVDAHFKAVSSEGTPTVIHFDAAEMSLADAVAVQTKLEEGWKIDSALWSKLYDIKNSESMTPEEKKAALDEAFSEYAGLAAAVQKDIVDLTDVATTDQFSADAASAQDPLDKRFKAEREKMIAQFAAREKELVARENKLLETDLLAAGLAGPVVKNFLALRNHLDGSTNSIQFKAGDTVEDVSPRVAFERFLVDMARRVKDGTFAATTEAIEAGNLSDDERALAAANATDDAISKSETAAIEKFMADNKITNFAAARRQWLVTDQGQKFRAKTT